MTGFSKKNLKECLKILKFDDLTWDHLLYLNKAFMKMLKSKIKAVSLEENNKFIFAIET